MKMLDLFAGLEGWSEPWREAGHEVFSVDYDESFDVDLHADILTLSIYDLPWQPDVVLASPPCEKFSVLTIGKNWNKDNTPKTEEAAYALRLAQKTAYLIAALQPRAWLIENPRAKLRKLHPFDLMPRTTVWYCRYGLPFAKPTDLFGVVPGWTPRPQCQNGNPDHQAAPRGSTTGIQGGNKAKADRLGSLHQSKAAAREYYGTSSQAQIAALRAKVPYELSAEVMRACEEW